MVDSAGKRRHLLWCHPAQERCDLGGWSKSAYRVQPPTLDSAGSTVNAQMIMVMMDQVWNCRKILKCGKQIDFASLASTIKAWRCRLSHRIPT